MKKIPLIETPIPGRICWLCEHVYFAQADSGYSEYTPGTDFRLSCLKDYWDFDAYGDSLDDFRRKLESAEQCATFTERKHAK